MKGVRDGSFEVFVKSIRAILGNQNELVRLETLRTVVAEVVAILKSRPLLQAATIGVTLKLLVREISCFSGETSLYLLNFL